MEIVLLGAAAVVIVLYMMRRRNRLHRELRDAEPDSGATGGGA